MNLNQRAQRDFHVVIAVKVVGAVVILFVGQVSSSTLAVIQRVVRIEIRNSIASFNVKFVVCGPHVRPSGGCTTGRHNFRSEYGALCLHRHVGAVMVPPFVATQRLHYFVVILMVDFAIFTNIGKSCSREFEIAEPFRKIVLAFGTQKRFRENEQCSFYPKLI